MVSNVSDVVKAIKETPKIVLVRVESALGYPIFFPVNPVSAINILEGVNKSVDWCISEKGNIIIG